MLHFEILALAVVLAADAVVEREPSQCLIRREAQAAMEITRAPWPAASDADRRRWAVLRTTPASGSGSTGNIRTFAGFKDLSNELQSKSNEYQWLEGEWRTTRFWVDSSEPRASRGRCDWLLPIPSPFALRVVEPMTLFNPFAEGPVGCCVVVLRADAPKVGGKPAAAIPAGRPWDDSALLPQGWETELPKAWDQKNDFDLVVSNACGKQDLEAVRRLLRSENPVIATFAFQHLLSCKAVDADLAREVLKASKGAKRVVVVYLLGQYVELLGGEAFVRSIVSQCSLAKDADELREYAAGALAAANFTTDGSPQFKFGDAVLDRVKQRVLELNFDAETRSEFRKARPFPRDDL